MLENRFKIIMEQIHLVKIVKLNAKAKLQKIFANEVIIRVQSYRYADDFIAEVCKTTSTEIKSDYNNTKKLTLKT